MTKFVQTIAVLLCLFVSGCVKAPQIELQYLPDVPQPLPIVDIPHELRVENWIGVDVDGDSGGSCVHASAKTTFGAAGRDDLLQEWARNKHRGYEGPETASRIKAKLRNAGVPFLCTSSADSSMLQAATDTHRPGIIFYYPNHCVNFIGYDVLDGRDVAILLDNNFVDKYIVIDRLVFDRSWDHYGGWGLVPWLEPVAPKSFPRVRVKSHSRA